MISPLKRCHSSGYGGLAADLFRIIVANRVALADLSPSVGSPGQIQHGFCQRGFARAAVAGQSQIDDIPCFIKFHIARTLLP